MPVPYSTSRRGPAASMPRLAAAVLCTALLGAACQLAAGQTPHPVGGLKVLASLPFADDKVYDTIVPTSYTEGYEIGRERVVALVSWSGPTHAYRRAPAAPGATDRNPKPFFCQAVHGPLPYFCINS